jgi:hypothetical protein
MSSVLLGSVVTAACGAPIDAEQGPEALGTSSEELTNTEICALIDELGEISLGDDSLSATVTATCEKKVGRQLSYLGGASPAKFSKHVSQTEAKSLFCALKGADDQTAPATWPTGVGTFGTSTKVNIYKSDPAAMTLSGQRVATLYAFGVGLRIDNQTFGWSFPTEAQPSQQVLVRVSNPLGGPITLPSTLPEQTGQYARGTTTFWDWNVKGNVSFPIGPLGVQLDVTFDNSPIFRTAARRGYQMEGITGSLADQRDSSWSQYITACRECQAQQSSGSGVVVPCNCPTSAESTQASRLCGDELCTPEDYESLSDGRVPHENRRGAAYPFWDAGAQNMSDFWHYGRPGEGTRAASNLSAADEPIFSIADPADAKNATTALDINLGFKYDVGIAAVNLSVHMDNDWRSGVALRTYREPWADVSGQERVTEIGLDAEAAVGVNARLVINADLPFVGGVIVLDETFDIIKRTTRQSSDKIPGLVLWDEATDGTGKLITYRAKGQSSTFDSCLQVPAVDEAPIESTTPQDFVNQLSDKVPEQLFPCNVTICAPLPVPGMPLSKRSCTWDKATKSLKCSIVSNSCSCLDNNADLCDAAGNVYKAKQENNPGCFTVVK